MRHARHLAMATLLLVCACQREQRRYQELPALSGLSDGKINSTNRPGHPGVDVPSFASGSMNPALGALYNDNAWAIAQGKQLYTYFNCIGCHFHGGGGIGPALMDERWLYGSAPEDIYKSIVEGRPQGMPAFRGKIPDNQVFQLVAYVRSMSGLVPLDVRPGRSDHMAAKPPETLADELEPLPAEHP